MMKLTTCDAQRLELQAEVGETLGAGGFKTVQRIDVLKGGHRLSMAMGVFLGTGFSGDAQLTRAKHQILKSIGVRTHATMRVVQDADGLHRLLMTDQTKGGKKLLVSPNNPDNADAPLSRNVGITPETQLRIQEILKEQARITGLAGISLHHDCLQYIVGTNAAGEYVLEDVIVGDLDNIADSHGNKGQWKNPAGRPLPMLESGQAVVTQNNNRLQISYLLFLLRFSQNQADRTAIRQTLQQIAEPSDGIEGLLD
jgi:hypothetical protein